MIKRFKQFIDEGLAQDRIHNNPTVNQMKNLAKNSRYGTARFVIYKDGSHVAGDSEKYTHNDIAPAIGAWHSHGYIDHHENGSYSFKADEAHSGWGAEHPLISSMEKRGMKNTSKKRPEK